MANIILVLEDIRSTHNVGSILRSADGFGVKKIYICGITPYPLTAPDSRLPHLAAKLHKQIAKTSLGAEDSMDWEYAPDIQVVLNNLQKRGLTIAALEQTSQSLDISKFICPEELVLVLGNEVEGVSQATLNRCKICLEIPMKGAKESFNVSVAAAVALYALQLP